MFTSATDSYTRTNGELAAATYVDRENFAVNNFCQVSYFYRTVKKEGQVSKMKF